ncbi:CRISPR-associated endonuclease Cas3'' [Candidatus Palauibacter sp.]|uniref:type I-G CRISPR-associated helicase/endonuclease Cas3g n=1 Tax=Candidatus Palauibacter sp. TaxID=3101350 RepID=UPI003B024937
MFHAAFDAGARPFEWQRALAEGELPSVLVVPTGSGKTAGVTLAWAYHRIVRPETTPRRLVWCLPMRTLVDQTKSNIARWLDNLAGKEVNRGGALPLTTDVHLLMGGVDSGDWLEKPERPAILIGTQDMLLSRALMRGYASSRPIWPMEFAILHQDTQWVFDEVQLMGAGRATSAQLEAFRQQEFGKAEREGRPAGRRCRSLWISATLKPEWLETVDHAVPANVVRIDPTVETDGRLLKLARAAKHLQAAAEAPQSAASGDEKTYLSHLANSVVNAHRRGYMTLVIVNQVKRAQALHDQVGKVLKARRGSPPALVLLHSRFRPADRKRETDSVTGAGLQADIIAIATQAVEAGVDISAAVMFTELAPWASMVQRFGRANRRAEVDGGARVFWVDLFEKLQGDAKTVEKQATALSMPYEVDELREARRQLLSLADAAPIHLPPPGNSDPPLRVIRRKDLDDLFDTDADLTGFDVDVSPYVRDAEDTDIRVYWREFPITGESPPKPNSAELCAVPIGAAKKWIKLVSGRGSHFFYVRDPQWRPSKGRPGSAPAGWIPLREPPWPGLTVLADVRAGGYSDRLGFTGNRKNVPSPVDSGAGSVTETGGSTIHSPSEEVDGHDDDSRSATGAPVLLTDHLRHVAREASLLGQELGLDAPTMNLIVRAACWHDLGKAHDVFQDTMRRGLDGHDRVVAQGALLAKTVSRSPRHTRAYFRHELASALAFLAHSQWSRSADLGAYLIAAHHGKVRMNLRALPRESAPKDAERAGARFARGVWEGDELPALDLGDDQRWPGGRLTLAIMELGRDEVTKESWTERTRELLSQHGPFRLAWLETLLRIADWRASRKEETGEYDVR